MENGRPTAAENKRKTQHKKKWTKITTFFNNQKASFVSQLNQSYKLTPLVRTMYEVKMRF